MTFYAPRIFGLSLEKWLWCATHVKRTLMVIYPNTFNGYIQYRLYTQKFAKVMSSCSHLTWCAMQAGFFGNVANHRMGQQRAQVLGQLPREATALWPHGVISDLNSSPFQNMSLFDPRRTYAVLCICWPFSTLLFAKGFPFRILSIWWCFFEDYIIL